MRFEALHQKMFTRRNWLLRCSILINIAVILYICSHVMIGGSNNFNSGSSFFLSEPQQLVAKETPFTKNVSKQKPSLQVNEFNAFLILGRGIFEFNFTLIICRFATDIDTGGIRPSG